MDKLLLHFVARDGEKQRLSAQLPELTRSLRESLGSQAHSFALVAREDDPMRTTGTGSPARAFDATIELRVELRDSDLARAVHGLAGPLDPLIHTDLSAVLVGTNKAFLPCAPTPIRFQYCMRRRADFTPSAYLLRYADVHSAFGLRTRGIAGYTQFHVDREASRSAARGSGLGVWDVSSVSELHLLSLDEFFAAAESNRALGAQEDEDCFVDRASSVMWLSDEVFRL